MPRAPIARGVAPGDPAGQGSQRISTIWVSPGSGWAGSGILILLMKRAAVAIGLDATKLAGHSLRAGYATEAAHAGKPLFVIQQQLDIGASRW